MKNKLTKIAFLLLATVFLAGCNNTSNLTIDEALQLREGDNIKGGQNAKVTMIEYSDFECPACASFYPVVKQALEEFPEDLQVVYRHYPLSQHPKAVPASRAAEAAAKQGKFWEMHDLIFENQSTWSTADNHEEVFKQYAVRLELDVDKFMEDYSARSTRKRIEQDKNDGSTLPIQGTPTIFLNNEKITPMPYAQLKTLIEQARDGQPLSDPSQPAQPL